MVKTSKDRLGRMKELTRFKALITQFHASDFDGHTDFIKLSSEQRLSWLSCCAYFLDQLKKDAHIRTSKHPHLGTLPNSLNDNRLSL